MRRESRKGAVVALIGAQLGNQLFQYAAARALAIHRSSQLVLYLDPGGKNFLEGNYPLQASWWTDADRRLHRDLLPFMGNSLVSRALKKIELLKAVGRRRWHEYTRFNYDPCFFNLAGNVFLKGYWQSFRYFHHIKPYLQEELRYSGRLSPEITAMARRIVHDNAAVAIHVRRGLNVINNWPVLTNDYFARALAVLREKTGEDRQDLYVFSDDVEWCQKGLLPEREKVVVSSLGTSSQEDVHLMSLCRHFIISPSTFSWWAAYLSTRQGTVIAPDGWFFRTSPEFRQEDVYLPDWIALKY